MLEPKEIKRVMTTIEKKTLVHFIWLTCTSNELCVLCSLTTAICNAERYREREKIFHHLPLFFFHPLCAFLGLFGISCHRSTENQNPKMKNSQGNSENGVDPKQFLRESYERINNFKDNLLFLTIFQQTV